MTNDGDRHHLMSITSSSCSSFSIINSTVTSVPSHEGLIDICLRNQDFRCY
ncbi:unnamed protein product [Coffea canephora]|uniref:Uncharacterized protein n=1 Tax=Coffea canephora TaxID=49390 RepID=A0A068U5H5_COFCA|nr:unnamed protein product [Coffea canephora]